MKGYLYAIAVIVLVVGLGWACHAVYDAIWQAGYNARIAEESSAAQTVQDKAIANATKRIQLDQLDEVHFSKHVEQVHSFTLDLEDAIHAPEPNASRADDAQLVPDPFPAGFSVCINAAGTHRAADLAACQASRRHAALPADAAHAQGEH